MARDRIHRRNIPGLAAAGGTPKISERHQSRSDQLAGVEPGIVGGYSRADRFIGADTACVRAGSGPDPWCRALATPVVQSTTYEQPHVGATGIHAYSRVSNPTVSALETQLGDIEDAPPAVCFATGLAAEHSLLTALLKAGDHAVVGKAVYGGTTRLFHEIFAPLGVKATFVDATDPREIERAIRPETKLVFAETPANPTLTLTDIRAVAAITRRAGATLILDNTFLTPVLQRPLDLGADVTVYSTTKHIEGHSTSLGGSVVSRDEKLLERVRFIRKCVGSIQAPFQAFLTSRGVSTLRLRLERHSRNALTVARYLEQHPLVARVNYPGLESHPQYALALAQHLTADGGDPSCSHGGIVSFEVVGGFDAGKRVLEGVQLCTLAEHLGATETLITHPASMTHADVKREARLDAGISDGLIRISVGLEDPRDVIADLEQAIAIANEQASRDDGADAEVVTLAAGAGVGISGVSGDSRDSGAAGT
jgi:cystathionine beta-lyase/cystathionine gamma-synthase